MECQAFKMNEFTERRKSVDSKLLTLFIKVICKLQVSSCIHVSSAGCEIRL